MRLISRSIRIVPLLVLLLAAAQYLESNSVDITIDRSGVLLKGKFHAADGAGNLPTVVLLAGLPGNENDVLGIGDQLSQSGINALTFNYSGTHQSEGKCSHNNILLDIQATFEYLHQPQNISRHKIDTSLIYLGGYCAGGGMALAYAAVHPEINSVFFIAGSDQGEFFRQYVDHPEMRKMIDDGFAEMSAPTGVVRFEAGGTPKEIVEARIEKMNPALDLKKNAASLAEKDILLIAGWNDDLTTIERFILPLYRALQNEKAQNVRITAFQDDHSFGNSRKELAQIIIEWIKTAPERKKLFLAAP